ncbi:hypothetical protein R0J87_21935, partial [Halomonas sp. SIMBA_159]
PMPQPTPANPASPLSDEQQRQFAEAGGRVKKLTRASRMAMFNGVSMLVLGGLCLPFVLMDPVNGVAAVVLGGLGAAELYGRSRIQR